ncbi:MAG: GYD domain-containing protein [Chloroflexi bacterium]|nr:GYD domain-containing protein [Chloroflexota bacterium]MBA3741239.1 GYD domain-containing protein [Chloroflexota bacterium]
MSKYLIIGSYTADGAKGVLKEGGTARRKAAEQVIRSVGGTVDAFYLAFGSDDFYVLVDAPDHAAIAAASLTVGASGAARTRTIVLITPEEADAATKLSPEYRPPGA